MKRSAIPKANKRSKSSNNTTKSVSYQLTEHFYKQVLESLSDYAVFTTDTKRRVNSWNAGAQKLLGYTEDEILGIKADVLFVPADIEKKEPQHETKTAIKEGKAADNRYHRRKDGSEFWVGGLLFPLYDEKHKHIGFTKVMRDLTEAKKTEQNLAETKEYAESIVETAREPLIVLHSDLTINAVNRAFCNTFKVDKNDTFNKKIYDLQNGQWNIPKLRELLEVIVPQNESFNNYEVMHEFSEVGTKTLLLNARKLYRPGNHTNMILLAIEDITERKVSETTKDTFISIASHELKTPITTIKAFAQTAQQMAEQMDNNPLHYPLKRINELTDKLTTLLSKLLDESMLSSGKFSLQKEKFSLTELAASTIKDFQTISPKHIIHFSAEHDCFVFADKIRIRQVITNLLSNAIKYSPEADKVNITIKQNGQQRKASLCVKDYGIGINEEDKKLLFQKFSRASNVRKTNIAGIGLGLHISNEIMKQHGGEIIVTSIENRSTEFCFSLPCQ